MNLKDSIIAETENWVAINKPSGLLSIPEEKYGDIFTVHRIDRDTSGLIIFAKNENAHKYLSKQFEDRQTKKIYQGLVIGSPAVSSGSIEARIMEHPALNGTMIIHAKGKEALTDYEVLEDFGIFSFLQFRIHTGRTHQIRVHMKDLGYPIVCDPLYGDGKPLLLSAVKSKFKLSKNELEERPILGRLALHAYQLSFTDIDGKITELEAPLHKDMRATLQQLAKRKKR
jgi:23S rRNA pseudouridine1911/1915/1917 synthase